MSDTDQSAGIHDDDGRRRHCWRRRSRWRRERARGASCRAQSQPVVIASGNGTRFKNGGTKTVRRDRLRKDDARATTSSTRSSPASTSSSSIRWTTASATAGCRTPTASCSSTRAACTARRRRAGGVGALEGVKTPSLVAKAVMEQTDHHLLVGKDAQTFARNLGFEIFADLNTPNSRAKWLEWKQRTDPLHYIKDRDAREAARCARSRSTWSPRASSTRTTSTARSTATASTRSGDVCGVTTTSGLAWKIPGRLGDSPILGAGLYVDGDVGAAGSTGRGEANLYNLCSYPHRRGDAARRAAEGRRDGGAAAASRRTRSRSGC